jgi:hypothetical protein
MLVNHVLNVLWGCCTNANLTSPYNVQNLLSPSPFFEPRLALNFQSFCLNLLVPGITGIHYHSFSLLSLFQMKTMLSISTLLKMPLFLHSSKMQKCFSTANVVMHLNVVKSHVGAHTLTETYMVKVNATYVFMLHTQTLRFCCQFGIHHFSNSNDCTLWRIWGSGKRSFISSLWN